MPKREEQCFNWYDLVVLGVFALMLYLALVLEESPKPTKNTSDVPQQGYTVEK